ncbi:type II secretion system F family protein [Mariniblastus fucicola]|uniref:Bacterial type II secretion system protein F domain protein n=1 Tax=Mariniblastus fucicola TaxID=980251 RepID=A0A5B9P779_9BACT|nr:type II secretion system F family protein [Mariniblastus fucicola]QEG22158.1 Bacterial type II secretion system protein F domain protein [Mariniblastus fucicola]
MGTYIIIGLITLGVAGAIFAVSLIFMGDNEKLDDRLANLTRNGGRGTGGPAEAAQSSILRTPLEEAPNIIESQMQLLIKTFNLRKFIEQSNVDISVANFILMTLGLGVGVSVIACVMLPAKLIWAGPLAGGLLATFPYIYIWFKRGRRLKRFATQLPQALDLMAQALRAGQSLPAGIQLVGQQVPDPLGPEFHTAYEQQNLGSTIVDSLEQMCTRVPDLDLRFFATAVMLQRQTGGDLAEILDKIGKLIRERMQIKGMIQALTGEGRISGAVLLAMPPILFLVMLKLNYKYVMKLFEEPMGHQMLAVAIVMQVVGALWIKKIINIKV